MIKISIHKMLYCLILITMMSIQPPISTANDKKNYSTSAENIQARVITEKQEKIEVTWKLNSKNSGNYVLGRSEVPINSQKDILKSKLMSIFSSVQRSRFIDKTALPGKKYYYVIVSKKELNSKNMPLRKGSNVTTQPVSIAHFATMVKDIDIITRRNELEVEWEDPKKNRTYGVYRSTSPISGREELGAATKIGTTSEREFRDKNIVKYATYYYAITVIDSTGKEHFFPIKDQNYTTKGAFIKKAASSTPVNIKATLSGEKSITIKWVKPEIISDNELAGYEVYRSSTPINSAIELKKATLIKIVPKTKTLLRDNDLKPGQWYYAIFTRFKNGYTDINFTYKNNHTESPITIGSPYRLTKLYISKKKLKTMLHWEYTGDFGEKIFQVALSKFSEPYIYSIAKRRIQWTNIEEKSLDISDLANQRQFIALFPKNYDPNRKLELGIDIVCITRNPLRIKKEGPKKTYKTEIVTDRGEHKKSERKEEKTLDTSQDTPYKDFSQDERLNEIIDRTFYKQKYVEAIIKLKQYRESSEIEEDRAKALLFMGKSYIELGKYKTAVKILNPNNFPDFYISEANFWFNFASMQIK